MEEITIEPLIHRGQESMALHFAINVKVQGALRKTGVVKWSRTHHCWYAPLSKENYTKVYHAVKGMATLNHSALRRFLEKKKVKKQPHISSPPTVVIKKETAVLAAHKLTRVMPALISTINAQVLPKMKERLTLKAYSNSTTKTYLNEMAQLLQVLGDVPADGLTTVHLKRYLVYCFEKLGLKENTLHSRINALKFYYEQVLGREKFFWDIPRPKKPLLLPKLLNEKELAQLFNSLINKKHKAMLFTAYSAGLRVSEIVKLKLSDIDSRRMQIFIGRAKGKKDRYVNLSPLLLDILRSYIQSCKPRPAEYLFESEQTKTAYPARTVQQIFSTARHKAGITKEVGIHSLRHSFATHLLDKGTDIKYIKDLLGHFDIRTTERYLHVSKKQLVNIVSPFDDLWKKESIDW